MFQDTKEGQTHFENDGCGEPAHNKYEPSPLFVRRGTKNRLPPRGGGRGNQEWFVIYKIQTILVCLHLHTKTNKLSI